MRAFGMGVTHSPGMATENSTKNLRYRFSGDADAPKIIQTSFLIVHVRRAMDRNGLESASRDGERGSKQINGDRPVPRPTRQKHGEDVVERKKQARNISPGNHPSKKAGNVD